MITVIATYQLPKPITRDEARRIFLSTAPKYQDVPGLVRKYYVLSQDGNSVGGIYLWKSRAEAGSVHPRRRNYPGRCHLENQHLSTLFRRLRHARSRDAGRGRSDP